MYLSITTFTKITTTLLINKKLPVTYIFKEVKLEIVYVIVIGFVAYYLTLKFRLSLPTMPIAIPAFIGTAISVILSFKLNQSYDRWWEARKIWGQIVNDSRNFVLQLQTFVAPGNEPAIKTIAFRQIGWCHSLANSLRGLDPLNSITQHLSATDIQEISSHNNKPLAILQLNTNAIKELAGNGELNIFSQIQLNNTMVSLTNAMGMAERIKTTVFPVTYRIYLHMIIYLFIITLSISLKDIESYFEIPLLLFISMAFFLLEKTATQLQDPFSNKPTDVAVLSIARTIEINSKQLLKETEIPDAYPSEKFYLM